MVDMQGWRPIAEASKDFTLYDLMVVNSPGHLTDDLVTVTIGQNGFDHCGIDEWQYVGWNWCQDVFGDVKTGEAVDQKQAPIPVFFRERPQDTLSEEVCAEAIRIHNETNPEFNV